MVVDPDGLLVYNLGNCPDDIPTGPDFSEQVLVADLDLLPVSCVCFHIFQN